MAPWIATTLSELARLAKLAEERAQAAIVAYALAESERDNAVSERDAQNELLDAFQQFATAFPEGGAP